MVSLSCRPIRNNYEKQWNYQPRGRGNDPHHPRKRALDAGIYGRDAVSTFADAVVRYLEYKPRTPTIKATVQKLLGHFGIVKLRTVDQTAVDAMCKALVAIW